MFPRRRGLRREIVSSCRVGLLPVAYMMLVRALRLHLAEDLTGRVGWLFALSDKQMSAAITSMHDEPAHDWTVEGLGQRAGMSRSTFALRFKETVGVSPMEYLTRWRMRANPLQPLAS